MIDFIEKIYLLLRLRRADRLKDFAESRRIYARLDLVERR